MMESALYSVPQNTPTPTNTITHATREANGQFPIFSVNAEIQIYKYVHMYMTLNKYYNVWLENYDEQFTDQVLFLTSQIYISTKLYNITYVMF